MPIWHQQRTHTPRSKYSSSSTTKTYDAPLCRFFLKANHPTIQRTAISATNMRHDHRLAQGKPTDTPETPSTDPAEQIPRVLPSARLQCNPQYAIASRIQKQSAACTAEEAVRESDSRYYVYNPSCGEELKAQYNGAVTPGRKHSLLEEVALEVTQSESSIGTARHAERVATEHKNNNTTDKGDKSVNELVGAPPPHEPYVMSEHWDDGAYHVASIFRKETYCVRISVCISKNAMLTLASLVHTSMCPILGKRISTAHTERAYEDD